MTDFSRWFVAAALALSPGLGEAQAQYLISTYAGGLPQPTAATATQYAIQLPTAVATDRYGDTYISSSASCVFRLSATKLSRVAGTCQAGYSGDGGNANSAQLNSPQALAIDALGNLYISDTNNNRIRKVTPAGIITTIAGTGAAGFGGDGSAATAAQLNNPRGIALDNSGNLYIADQLNYRIRKVSNGIITSVAGTGGITSGGNEGDGGPATAATFSNPIGLAVDSSGTVYISDAAANNVRKFSPGGSITRFAGTGTFGYSGDNGPALSAKLAGPTAVAFDRAGNLYIADQSNSAVRKVSGGTITTYAGGQFGSGGDTGTATNAQLLGPSGIALDYTGNLYIADTYPGDPASRVRMVNSGGTISTVAGNGLFPFGGDGGPAGLAQLASPWGVASDGSGNLYIADWKNYRVRQITSAGTISTYAGNGTQADTGDGNVATSASVSVSPYVVAADSTGNIYLGDQAIVRKIAAGTHIISTVAGTGSAGYSGDNNTATLAKISLDIKGLVVDSSGNIYIADYDNYRIRKVTAATGFITTIAGSGTPGYGGDNGPATSSSVKLNNPAGLALDKNGNLYIADSLNNRVRKVSNGTITTFAGNGLPGPGGDGGLATAASISNPIALAFDSAGNLFIATGDNTVRKVNTAGIISTVAGTGAFGYAGDGGPATAASLNNPFGLATDSNNNVFVADQRNNAVRVLQPIGTEPVLSVTSTHASSFIVGDPESYTLTVKNAASAASTTGAVAATVTEILPAGLAMMGMSGGSWSCSDVTPPYTCTSTAAVGPGGQYSPITVNVNVASGAIPQVTNSVAVSGAGALGASGMDATSVTGSTSALEISLTHPGNFFVAEQGVYTITVANQFSAADNTGAVTVTDTLPAGFNLASITGNNWQCTNGTVSCTRSDALPSGAGYDPIYVTVDVTSSAQSSVTNTAIVTWAGSSSQTANDQTNVVTNPCDVTGGTLIGITDVQEMVNEALGISSQHHDLNTDGVVSVTDIQIVINAVIGLSCTV